MSIPLFLCIKNVAVLHWFVPRMQCALKSHVVLAVAADNKRFLWRARPCLAQTGALLRRHLFRPVAGQLVACFPSSHWAF